MELGSANGKLVLDVTGPPEAGPIVEFSPSHELGETFAVVERNMQAAAAS